MVTAEYCEARVWREGGGRDATGRMGVHEGELKVKRRKHNGCYTPPITRTMSLLRKAAAAAAVAAS